MLGRVGWKPRFFDPRVASTRIRCLNPLAELQSVGYPVELFDRRRSSEYAAVVYSKLYDDASYKEALALQQRGARIVLDLCDNHFYNPNGLASLSKAEEQLKRMMQLADALVASTAAMAELMRAQFPCARDINVIEDGVETEITGVRSTFWESWRAESKLSKLLQKLAEKKENRTTPLVWFGIHGGSNAEYGMLDLLKRRPLLETINGNHPLSLTVISNSKKKYDRAIKPWSFPTYYLEWHPQTVFAALRAHRIAIIPVSQNPFTHCKSNNRLALSLSLGLAVVADSIPSYRDFADVCFLDEWRLGLERYLSDSELRQQHVERGQALVLSEWSTTRIAEKWRDFFDVLLERRHLHMNSLGRQEIASEGFCNAKID
jgi:hypothetical protein